MSGTRMVYEYFINIFFSFCLIVWGMIRVYLYLTKLIICLKYTTKITKHHLLDVRMLNRTLSLIDFYSIYRPLESSSLKVNFTLDKESTHQNVLNYLWRIPSMRKLLFCIHNIVWLILARLSKLRWGCCDIRFESWPIVLFNRCYMLYTIHEASPLIELEQRNFRLYLIYLII